MKNPEISFKIDVAFLERKIKADLRQMCDEMFGTRRGITSKRGHRNQRSKARSWRSLKKSLYNPIISLDIERHADTGLDFFTTKRESGDFRIELCHGSASGNGHALARLTTQP